MKFQFRLLTLLAFVASLGLMIGLNVRTQWNSVRVTSGPDGISGPLVAYGWPCPVYFTKEYKVRISHFFRTLGPGLELDMVVINCVVAGLFVGGACYLARRMLRKESP